MTLLPGNYAISEPNAVQISDVTYVASVSQPTANVKSGQVTAVTVVFVQQPASGSAIEVVGSTGRQAAMASTQFHQPLAVLVTSGGEPGPGRNCNLLCARPTSTSPGAIFNAGTGAGSSTTTVTTDANGYATVPVTGGTVSGDYTITGTAPGAWSATFIMANVQRLMR